MERKIHKILACIDLSKYSLMTLGYALELTQGTQTKIVVFNVINQRDINGVEMATAYFPGYFSNAINAQDYVDMLTKDRHANLKRLIRELGFEKDPRLSIKIDMGIPFECILKATRTENADLIVMANKGKGNISRALFGSAAEKVFRHSVVPVISVRDRMKFKRIK